MRGFQNLKVLKIGHHTSHMPLIDYSMLEEIECGSNLKHVDFLKTAVNLKKLELVGESQKQFAAAVLEGTFVFPGWNE